MIICSQLFIFSQFLSHLFASHLLNLIVLFSFYFSIENFECLEDLVRAVVREFPLVKPNVGKQCSIVDISHYITAVYYSIVISSMSVLLKKHCNMRYSSIIKGSLFDLHLQTCGPSCLKTAKG